MDGWMFTTTTERISAEQSESGSRKGVVCLPGHLNTYHPGFCAVMK
jgi:hypothetical protein